MSGALRPGGLRQPQPNALYVRLAAPHRSGAGSSASLLTAIASPDRRAKQSPPRGLDRAEPRRGPGYQLLWEGRLMFDPDEVPEMAARTPIADLGGPRTRGPRCQPPWSSAALTCCGPGCRSTSGSSLAGMNPSPDGCVRRMIGGPARAGVNPPPARRQQRRPELRRARRGHNLARRPPVLTPSRPASAQSRDSGRRMLPGRAPIEGSPSTRYREKYRRAQSGPQGDGVRATIEGPS